jgi:hypothetical protein
MIKGKGRVHSASSLKSIYMLRLLFVSTIVAVNLLSCNSKSDRSTDQVGLSYINIRVAFEFTKKAQEDFFDEAAVKLKEVRDNKDAIVDTKNLEELLESAKSASESRLSMIDSTEEVDDEIKYKEKALKYVTLLNSLYKNEMVQFVTILKSNAGDRFEKCKTLLYERMNEMKEQQLACKEAEQEVIDKYNIQGDFKIPENY